ncbi:EamA family transporter, partial [Arthrospira platensis PCC 7345]
LQQTALKFTAAGIAQTLTSTSPLFVLPIAIAMGDRVSWRAILGALVAIFGVAMLFLA